jgi:hypothetical protein
VLIMTRASVFSIVLIGMLTTVPARAIPVQLSHTGDDWTVSVHRFSPQPIVGFHIDFIFDASVIEFDSAVVGPYLGDPSRGEAWLDPFIEGFPAGFAHFQEISLLTEAELSVRQPPSFTLFTARFRRIGPGDPNLIMTGEANPATYWIPEPNSWLLLAGGVLTMMLARRVLHPGTPGLRR